MLDVGLLDHINVGRTYAYSLNPYCAGCGVAGKLDIPNNSVVFVLILIVLDVGLLDPGATPWTQTLMS